MSGARERESGRANGPVLTSRFLAVLNHRAMVRRTGPIACPHASSQAPRVLTPELIGNQDRESGGRKRGSGDGKRKRVSDEGVSDKRVNKDGANEDGAKMERMKTWGSQRGKERK